MRASSVRLHVVRVVAALFVLSLSLGARAGADPASERAASTYLDGIRSKSASERRLRAADGYGAAGVLLK